VWVLAFSVVAHERRAGSGLAQRPESALPVSAALPNRPSAVTDVAPNCPSGATQARQQRVRIGHVPDDGPIVVVDNVEDAITASVATIGIGAAAMSIALPPVGLGLGVAAGVLQLSQLVRKRIERRTGDVATGARERLGNQEADAARRITEDEDLAALAYHAVDASLLAHHAEQAVALGRVLGDALATPRRIPLDDASVYIEAMRSLDLNHFVALRALAAPDQEGGWVAIVRRGLDTNDDVIVTAIVVALVRAGALSIDPPGFGGYVITAFGLRLLHYVTQ
jgi:hypothetical protein